MAARFMLLLLSQVAFWGFVWLAVKKVPFFNREWERFKKLSKSGPLYKVVLWFEPKISAFYRRLLRGIYGDSLEIIPSQAPTIVVTTEAVDAVSIRWTAPSSSPHNRDTFEVEVRGSTAGITEDLPREWQPWSRFSAEDNTLATVKSMVEGKAAELTTTSAKTLTVGGLKPGQGVEIRCRTVNTRGVSAWSEHAKACTRQKPDEGAGGHGPGYRWRQTCDQVQILFPLGRVTTGGETVDLSGAKAKQVSFSCANQRLSLSVLPATPGVAIELVNGELGGPIETNNGAEWTFETYPGFGRCLVVTLDRIKPGFRKRPWERAFKGHPPVDITGLSEYLEDSALF